ncbi:MAG: alpha-galactosidase, partial [Anaerolineae bacterium]|nr:alpha-galactosidase [Thermoflexales bacterium]MDW8408521.1 alpha-galactosidase [Anaerolineae bacterium]
MMQGAAEAISHTEGWSVSNPHITCRVAVRSGCLMWQVEDHVRGRPAVWASEAPQVWVDGYLPRWESVQTAYEEQADGSTVLCCGCEAGRARLKRYFQVWPDFPFVRTWGVLENVSLTAFTVTAGEILNLALPPGQNLFHVNQFSWVYRNDFFNQYDVPLIAGRAAVEIRMGSFPSSHSGPSSCGWFAVRDGESDWQTMRLDDAVPHTGYGLVCGIEFNGKSRLRAWATSESTRCVSTIDDLHHHVAPGDTFEAPASFVGVFEGDWDEAGYVTQRFAEAHVHPPAPDERHPWAQYNSWGYGQEINEAQQLAAIERCAQLGIEVVVMDLGWARQIGEWRAHPHKFPRGLKPLADRAHELGMRFGLHIPLAQANVNAPVAQEHPDWLIHRGEDYFGAAPLCLGHPPCREWVLGEIVRLIDDYAVDYFVQDGEDMVKVCYTDHLPCPSRDHNYTNSVEGIDWVIENVRRLRPHVVWENCEDGGCMLTYKMARLYHTTITVDNIATYATRQGVYGASYPFSPRYSVRYMQDDPTPYTLRSAIFGGPLILMQRVTEWNETQMAQTRAAIAEY